MIFDWSVCKQNPDFSKLLQIYWIIVAISFQDTYYYLLRRYLESVCSSGCETRRVYLNLIGKLQDLHRLNESHIQVFLEVNPKLVGPLLIEIFDLKSANNCNNPTPVKPEFPWIPNFTTIENIFLFKKIIPKNAYL